ncbi:MAG TPA: nucleotidyltransferase family protein [Candidatus Cybelea sp.]|nr:nucleotidyltransferase family protein [Candidatus Cybelea sp.]
MGLWTGILAGLSVAGSGREVAAADAEAADRFARYTSPALAAHCFGATPGRAFDADAARQSRLLNRFVRTASLRAVRRIGEVGIDVLVLKGLGTAFALYADPDLRVLGDADILVRRGDLGRLIGHLEAEGYRFAAERGRSPWGFIGDASFQPMLSADGTVNLDLHVHCDAWPVHRGLSTPAIFAACRRLETPEGEIRVPAASHMLFLSATHSARDLFASDCAQSLVDAALLLRREGPTIDWEALRSVAAAARSLRPVCTFLALLARLGVDVSAVPAGLRQPPSGLRRGEFERLVRDAAALYPNRVLGWRARLRREMLVAAEPDVALWRNFRRLAGLLQPGQGLPAEAVSRTQ